MEVVDSENEMSVTVQFMTGEVEALEIHPVAINLIDPEQVYTITHTQKLFDQYKVIESIEETDTSWELVE
ncbi:hypothetical protein [Halalkalibacillus halophilus]|uniref:hypothetical protein n=1 Tax=Halalkalibacillus halophilus TaxID=392827 RepID=UPI00146A9909|nr:hypothetical protein [Halalkalibacillus halophilus]